MSQRTTLHRGCLTLLLCGVFGLSGILCAQDLFLPIAPQGLYTELLPAGLDARYDGEGFLFGVAVTGTYDSNVFGEEDAESDFSGTLAPWVQYSSAPPGGALWILNGRYSPFLRGYLDNSDLNGIDQSGQAALTYTSPVATLRTNVSYSTINQVERFQNGRSDNERLTVGIDGTYTISQLSSLAARVSAGKFKTGTSLSETSTILAELTAFWQATPLIKVGPTIRYSKSNSDNYGDSEATALLASVAYEVSELVNLSASAGVEAVTEDRGGDDTRFTGNLSARYRSPVLPWTASAELRYAAVQEITAAQNDGGGGDSQITGSLRTNYQPAEDWDLGVSVHYETIPSPTERNYSIDDFTVQASVARDLQIQSIRGGVAASWSDYESVGRTTASPEDQSYYSLFLGHSIGLWDQRVQLDSSVRYSNNSGDRDWDRIQLSTGLNFVF